MIADAKKVTRMEGVQKPIPTELYEPCIAGHQELEISRRPTSKAAEFLERLHVDNESFASYFLRLSVFSFYQ